LSWLNIERAGATDRLRSGGRKRRCACGINVEVAGFRERAKSGAKIITVRDALLLVR